MRIGGADPLTLSVQTAFSLTAREVDPGSLLGADLSDGITDTLSSALGTFRRGWVAGTVLTAPAFAAVGRNPLSLFAAMLGKGRAETALLTGRTGLAYGTRALLTVPTIIAWEREPLTLSAANLSNALAEAGCFTWIAGLACRAAAVDTAPSLAAGEGYPLALLVADLPNVFPKAVLLPGLARHIPNFTTVTAAGGGENAKDDAAGGNKG